jgi:hypothetical protein
MLSPEVILCHMLDILARRKTEIPRRLSEN